MGALPSFSAILSREPFSMTSYLLPLTVPRRANDFLYGMNRFQNRAQNIEERVAFLERVPNYLKVHCTVTQRNL